MRTISFSALFLFIFLCCTGISVFAEGKEATLSNPEASVQEVQAKGTFEAKATVPEGFDKTVLINFTSNGRQNIMARLDQMNGYVSSQEVHVGTYEVDFINIVGGNARDYNINAPGQIVIIEGDVASFHSNISLKSTAIKPEVKTETKTESIQPVQRSAVPLNEAVQGTEIDSSAAGSPVTNDAVTDVVVVPDPKADTSANAAVEKTPSKAALHDTTVTTFIGVGALVLLVLLFFLYKQVIYKHDYYDC